MTDNKIGMAADPDYEKRLDALPETERAARENLALPLWAGIDEAQQRRVVERVRSASTVGAPA